MYSGGKFGFPPCSSRLGEVADHLLFADCAAPHTSLACWASSVLPRLAAVWQLRNTKRSTITSYYRLDDEMMNDRLAELRGGGAPFVDLEARGGGSSSSAGAGSAPFMEAFFEEVQEIKKAMSSIRLNIRQIEQSHGECLTAISAESSRASTEQLESLMKATIGFQ